MIADLMATDAFFGTYEEKQELLNSIRLEIQSRKKGFFGV